MVELENKEWGLTEVALALTSRSWYATVTWHKGKLTLIVKGPKALAKLNKEKSK